MKYDAQINEVFRDVFNMAKPMFTGHEIELAVDESIAELGGYNKIDRDIEDGIRNGVSATLFLRMFKTKLLEELGK